MPPKRTPCVGICSTTYGDLVCRGCKRFAHEVVQWNSYNEAQQASIWQRLRRLRSEVLRSCLQVVDQAQYAQACADAGIDKLQGAEQQYELLRFLVSGCRALHAAGLAVQTDGSTMPAAKDEQEDEQQKDEQKDGQIDGQKDEQEALRFIQWVDAQMYSRSLAHYERNFRVQP